MKKTKQEQEELKVVSRGSSNDFTDEDMENLLLEEELELEDFEYSNEHTEEQTLTEFIISVANWLAIFIASVMILLIGINYFTETTEEKILKIQSEISELQQLNIDNATRQLSKLYVTNGFITEDLRVNLHSIEIYNQCIKINTYGDFPVECTTVTLSLEQKLGWLTNSNGLSQSYKHLKSKGNKERMEELLGMHSLTINTLPIWEKYGKEYGIKPQVAIAIAKADSSLGNELKTTNNIGNVGNNDSGDTLAYDTLEEGIEGIYRTLNNRYLNDIYTIGYLSQGGRTIVNAPSCSESNTFCYATSEENWNINVINTLRLLYNDSSIDETFKFRTK